MDLVWFIVNADSAQITSLVDAVFYGLQVFPAVAAILFPAALLARHPDAATRAPVLLLGTILFALVQLLLLLATPLAPVLRGRDARRARRSRSWRWPSSTTA